jgi:hypothetical protein
MPDQLEVSIRAPRRQVDSVLVPLARKYGLPEMVQGFTLNKPIDITLPVKLPDGTVEPVHLMVEEVDGTAAVAAFPSDTGNAG